MFLVLRSVLNYLFPSYMPIIAALYIVESVNCRTVLSTNMASLNVKSVLITGGNRGIGLEFVKQLLATSPKHVFVTYRDEGSSGELLKLAEENKNIHAIKFDVTDYDNIGSVVKVVQEKVGDDGLTLMINNAGILDHKSSIQDIGIDDMLKSFHINTIAPMMLIKQLLPLFKRAAATNTRENKFTANRAAIVYISTKVASLKDNSGGGLYPYRCSKVASNMMIKNLSIELTGDGILCLILHPGWVQTDMGGSNAIHGITESVSGMLKVVSAATESDTGSFHEFKGTPIPW